MKAYRTYVTVTDSQQLVVPNVPFKNGTRVEILVIADESERDQALMAFDAAFKTTQALPHVQALTDAEIETEIMMWRNEQ